MALLPTARFVVQDYFYVVLASIIRQEMVLVTGNAILMVLKSACIVEAVKLRYLLGPALTHAGPFLFSLSPSFFVTNVIELSWLL